MKTDKIRPYHLERKAILYVRQSSAHQVLHNRESSAEKAARCLGERSAKYTVYPRQCESAGWPTKRTAWNPVKYWRSS